MPSKKKKKVRKIPRKKVRRPRTQAERDMAMDHPEAAAAADELRVTQMFKGPVASVAKEAIKNLGFPYTEQDIPSLLKEVASQWPKTK